MRNGYKYIYTRGGCRIGYVMLGIHVDDQAIVGPNKHIIYKFKAKLRLKLKMKDLGPLTHILGVEVKQDRRNRVMTLHLGSYLRQVLERHGTMNPLKP